MIPNTVSTFMNAYLSKPLRTEDIVAVVDSPGIVREKPEPWVPVGG